MDALDLLRRMAIGDLRFIHELEVFYHIQLLQLTASWSAPVTGA
jgi:hypothetical protein